MYSGAPTVARRFRLVPRPRRTQCPPVLGGTELGGPPWVVGGAVLDGPMLGGTEVGDPPRPEPPVVLGTAELDGAVPDGAAPLAATLAQ